MCISSRYIRPRTHLTIVLRVQFLDAKTTKDRWREEIDLTRIELIRTADYFKWAAEFWQQRMVLSRTRGERAHAASMGVLFVDLEHKIRLIPV